MTETAKYLKRRIDMNSFERLFTEKMKIYEGLNPMSTKSPAVAPQGNAPPAGTPQQTPQGQQAQQRAVPQAKVAQPAPPQPNPQVKAFMALPEIQQLFQTNPQYAKLFNSLIQPQQQLQPQQ